MLNIVDKEIAKSECLPIDDVETAKKVLDPDALAEMFEILKKEDGVGLAAPQVGIHYKFFLAFIPQLDSWRVFINPRYEKIGDDIDFEEECLTTKGQKFRVKRSNKVKACWSEFVPNVEYFDHFETDLVEEMSAIIFQHETDHCNGVLVGDHGEEITNEVSEELSIREILEKERGDNSSS